MKKAVKRQSSKRFILLLITTIFVLSLGVQVVSAISTADPCDPGTELTLIREGHKFNSNNKILIDFNYYEARIAAECGYIYETDPAAGTSDFQLRYVYPDEDLGRDPTNVANGAAPGVRFDDTGAVILTIQKDEMELENWRVILNSSANTVENRVNSYALQVPEDPANADLQTFTCTQTDFSFYQTVKTAGTASASGADNLPVYTKYTGMANAPADCAALGDNIITLGIRIHFPTHDYNAWAKIQPPFDIQVYDEKGGVINLENGVVNNTGIIQTIKTTVAGRNYRHTLAVRLKDQNGAVNEYFMGPLFFTGWRTLSWSNPNYIIAEGDNFASIANRSMTRVPLYPYEVPHLVFDSFIIYRDGDNIGGDFITYIKRIEIKYDLAIPYNEELQQFEDEEIWQILSDSAQERAEIDRNRYVDYIDLIEQERQRMRGRE